MMSGLAAIRVEIERTNSQMAASAQAGDWEAALRLIDQRGRLIEALLSDPKRVGLAEVTLVRETLEADRSLNTLARSSRSSVMARLDEVRKGRRAARTYAENA